MTGPSAPLKGVTLAPRRCGACNGVGHTKRSRECPSHPERRCLDCNEQRRYHYGRRDLDHRFRSEPLIGDLPLTDLAPAVKP